MGGLGRHLRFSQFGEGILQLPVGALQFIGSFFHQLFEIFPVFVEQCIPLFDLSEHVVEAVDQGAHLVLGGLARAQSVIIVHADPGHGVV